jgi:hypothetical protein
MTDERAGLRVSQLLLPMTAYIIIGTPLVAYIWETLNLLVAGKAEAIRLLITLPAVALLAGVFVLLTRTISRWEGERKENLGTRGTGDPPPRNAS